MALTLWCNLLKKGTWPQGWEPRLTGVSDGSWGLGPSLLLWKCSPFCFQQCSQPSRAWNPEQMKPLFLISVGYCVSARTKMTNTAAVCIIIQQQKYFTWLIKISAAVFWSSLTFALLILYYHVHIYLVKKIFACFVIPTILFTCIHILIEKLQNAEAKKALNVTLATSPGWHTAHYLWPVSSPERD